MIFQTSPEQVAQLPIIAKAMLEAGVEVNLVTSAQKIAESCQGTFELMAIWYEVDLDREDCLHDLQDVIRDYMAA